VEIMITCAACPRVRQLPGGVETELLTQADINQHDIRLQRLDALDRLGTGAGHPRHHHSA
jgi:hypothetical protein